jgi:K+-transporting ATPase ATPase A chain
MTWQGSNFAVFAALITAAVRPLGGHIARSTVSFVTNTSWRSFGGETTFSCLVQMAGITVQSFLSGATGVAVAIALVRGFARRSAQSIGDRWVDLTRVTLMCCCRSA